MSDPRPLIVALDHASPEDALELAHRLDPARCRVKIANTLFVRAGPPLIETLASLGFDVFLDLKFHDIPMQVAGSCRSAADMGVWMMTVHAAGGPAMLRAASESISVVPNRPLVVAVTILTSLDDDDLHAIGMSGTSESAVARLAKVAAHNGIDGIVCSPMELAALRPTLPAPFLMVTPGIRPAGSDAGDQKRTTTPQEAITSGASAIVVGRPVTGAQDPMKVVEQINAEIGA